MLGGQHLCALTHLLWGHCVYSSFGFLYPTTETVSLVFFWIPPPFLPFFHFWLFSCVWVGGLLIYLPHVWTTFPLLCLILSILHRGRFLHYCFSLVQNTVLSTHGDCRSMFSFLDTRFFFFYLHWPGLCSRCALLSLFAQLHIFLTFPLPILCAIPFGVFWV